MGDSLSYLDNLLILQHTYLKHLYFNTKPYSFITPLLAFQSHYICLKSS